MTSLCFDVNDKNVRDLLFDHVLIDSVGCLGENSLPLWGAMSSQHMVEHLVWAFECSSGILEVPCRTPESVLERTKKFLSDDRQTPRGFKNPLLGEYPPPLRFPAFADAKEALHRELTRYLDHYRELPDAIHVHPIFGALGAEEWQRSHFKHCYHHLLQFNLVHPPDAESS